MHTRVSLCLRCHSGTVLQQTCAWARTCQRMAVCVCPCTCGTFAGAGGPGWQGDTHVMLCDAEPQVPLMPLVSLVPLAPLIPQCP